MTIPDPTALSDADLDELVAAGNAEKLRRSRLASAPLQLRKLFEEYVEAGGDPAHLADIAGDTAETGSTVIDRLTLPGLG